MKTGSRGLLFSFLVFLLSLIFGAVYIFNFPSQAKREAYHSLIHAEAVKKEAAAPQEGAGRQKRVKVTKQIFYTKGGQRLQTRLLSEKSDLILESKEEGGEFVELVKDLSCYVQDKFIEEDAVKKQHFRHLTAKEGAFHYKNGQLEASQVFLANYLLPAHLWPATIDSFSPFLEGNAKSIKFASFKGPALLKAQDFQAVFNHPDFGGALISEAVKENEDQAQEGEM